MTAGAQGRGESAGVVRETSGMLLIAYATGRALVGPLTWVDECIAQAALIVRRCLIPLLSPRRSSSSASS